MEERSPLSTLSESSGSSLVAESGEEDQCSGDAEERYCLPLHTLGLTLLASWVSEELTGRHEDWSALVLLLFLPLSPFSSLLGLSGILKIEDTISALMFDCDKWTLCWAT